MTVNPQAQWWIRISGNNANGGGYDSTISGATTNYCDQDTAQLSLTDVVTNGTTTVTSATGGFTSAMIGNAIQIGTDNCYFITACATSNSITVDRNTGTATGQNAKVGGAWADYTNCLVGGTLPQPVFTSPTVPGNQINIQGSGSDNPVAADYTYDKTKYGITVSGTTAGRVRFVGYNGRPQIDHSGIMHFENQSTNLENLCFFLQAGSTYPQYGIFYISTGNTAINCRVDVNGAPVGPGMFLTTAIGNLFINSGTPSALYTIGIALQEFGLALGNKVTNYGIGISGSAVLNTIEDNVLVNNLGDGINIVAGAYPVQFNNTIKNNTIDSNGGAGINFTSGNIGTSTCVNNTVTNNTGYGLTCVESAATAAVLLQFMDYNNVYNNTAGNYNNVPVGAHDLSVNPMYANPTAGDYTPTNTALQAAYPTSIP